MSRAESRTIQKLTHKKNELKMETLTYIRSNDLTKEPKLFNGEENIFLTKVWERDKHRKNEPCPFPHTMHKNKV